MARRKFLYKYFLHQHHSYARHSLDLASSPVQNLRFGLPALQKLSLVLQLIDRRRRSQTHLLPVATNDPSANLGGSLALLMH